MKMIFSVVICVLQLLFLTNGERLHEQIYSSIEGGAACFRRLNGTHQAGCSSTEKGTVGVVHMLNTVQDAQWLIQNATAGPYMAVVSTALFNDVIELFMQNPAKLAGILLYDSPKNIASSFTQDSRCPNEYSSAQGSSCSSNTAGGIVWNPMGTGLLRRDIPFPVFFLPQSRFEEIDKIQACFNKHNMDFDNQKGQPLCSLQLNTFMFAAVNSVVCMRRSASSLMMTQNKVCDPLRNHNVYYSLFPRGKASKKPVTLVTARIDTASLFDGLAPGAASSVVGLVTLLAAAATLSKMVPITDLETSESNILWTLFNGEAFDYIGSQRVAYDLAQGAWPPDTPLTPADIKLHVEIGQLGGSLVLRNNTWPLYAFAPSNTLPQITEFLKEFSDTLQKYDYTVMPKFTDNLPPSSLHSFRRILKNVTSNGDLPEVLIADHEETFTNMFYQSVLDDNDRIGFIYHNISIDVNGTFIPTSDLIANGTMKENEAQVKIAKLASAFASTLYQKVTGKPYTGDISVSAHLIDELLYCFLRSQACRLLLAADYAPGGAEPPPDRPAPLYVGVVAWASPPALFTGNLIALLTGNTVAANRTVCDKLSDPDFTYYWLRGWNHSGVCIQTTMNFSQAYSPAFTIPDYDFASGEYSTWTESVWQTMWARVFVSAGGGGARVAAATGVVVTILAAVLTYWLQKHASLVFASNAGVAGNDATGILRTVNC